MNSPKEPLECLVDEICASYQEESFHRIKTGSFQMPSYGRVKQILRKVKQILFPGYFGEHSINSSNVNYFVGEVLNEILFELSAEIEKAFQVVGKEPLSKESCSTLAFSFLKSIPKIRFQLKKDVCAALDGDPAAESIPEIISSYPCVRAIAIFRIAHELFLKNIPLIPRMMTEYAHNETGIDIHPGATIGSHFFIDHGTGVVIGETTLIGNHVKLYQGVTLGALSFPKDGKGKLIKGIKRHPTLEDRVTIYAGATILGGKTVIGENAVIGGNAWIVESVDPGKKILSNH